jgi:hypothetical protein
MATGSQARQMVVVALAALAGAVLSQILLRDAPEPAPRVIEARGDLAADETATIALFEAARGSVVSITTAGRVVDPWTRNA